MPRAVIFGSRVTALASASQDRPLTGLLVLLVEGDDGSTPSLSAFLTYAGALVSVVSPPDASAMLKQVQPNVIVADLPLSHGIGQSSLSVIASEAAVSSVPLLVLAAPEHINALQDAGFEVVRKPVETTALGEAIIRRASGVVAAHRAPKPRILIAEDHDDSRELLGVILRDYEVVFATNGEEALACFERDQPDLVILDVLMPVKA